MRGNTVAVMAGWSSSVDTWRRPGIDSWPIIQDPWPCRRLERSTFHLQWPLGIMGWWRELVLRCGWIELWLLNYEMFIPTYFFLPSQLKKWFGTTFNSNWHMRRMTSGGCWSWLRIRRCLGCRIISDCDIVLSVRPMFEVSTAVKCSRVHTLVDNTMQLYREKSLN